MNKPKIDRNRVKAMLNEGFFLNEIARRLGCSEKSIRRIKDELVEAGFRYEVQPVLKNKEIEIARMKSYRKLGFTLEAIAFRFGITRQAVYQILKENGRAE